MIPTLLCRQCMRKSHQHEPLHRIECWTGRYFAAAALWQVGVYILVKHQGTPRLCDSLKFQQRTLEDLQVHHDAIDQDECRRLPVAGRADEWITEPVENELREEYAEGSFSGDTSRDRTVFAEMDRLYEQRQGTTMYGKGKQRDDEDLQDIDDLPEDEDEDTDNDYWGPETSGHTANDIAGSRSMNGTESIPMADGLNNSYLRIGHVNGFHHLPVVMCACRGRDNLPIDLLYSRLVLTTFTRIHTLFTTMVLDAFRLANLELKASAYQYFQLLRRLTEKNTYKVPNLYHELRKVSRAWRWMKKLKWAGFGHKMADPMQPAAGELTLFCPACPQPHINLPPNWKDDPNRSINFILSY